MSYIREQPLCHFMKLQVRPQQSIVFGKPNPWELKSLVLVLWAKIVK